MSMTAGATTAVPRKTRLARSGTAALQHSRLGAVAYGRLCPVHVWPVLRCPPRLEPVGGSASRRRLAGGPIPLGLLEGFEETAHGSRYLSVKDAGSIGEDVTVVPSLQSTKTVRRLEFGPAGFTALTMGVQAEGSWNRSLLA